jgi:tetratricopeptide (TPR) repeat protein
VNSEKLGYAVQLIKGGNKQAALPVLKEIIQKDPKDENAWLWLYCCVDEVEQKKYCLQQALKINPGNQQSYTALKELTDQVSPPVLQASPAQTASPQSASSGNNREKNSWFFALGGGIVLVLMCIVAFLYLVQTRRISLPAASLPLLPSSTMAPSPTHLAISTPSSTNTNTATSRPSLTLTPIQDAITPTLTIMPFTPGNPTATPLGSDITDPNFIKGVAAYDADHYEDVVTLMSIVIETNPELAPPYRYRGMGYWFLGDCASGLVDQEKALSINPDYAVAWADRGLMKGCLGDKAQELQDFQKALSLDPSLAFVHFNLGVYYYGLAAYERSLEEYSLSAAIDPTRSDAWSGKSEVLRALGQFAECIVDASKSIQVNPKEWLAYSDRALCESVQEKYTEAINDFKVYTDNAPDDPIGWFNLGVAYGHRGDVYYDSGKYDQAIADYKMAVKLIPDDVHCQCLLASSYFAVGQYRGALDAAKSATAIDPSCQGRAQGLLEIEARSSYALGDYDQAIQYIDQALAQSSYPVGYYYRGIFYQAAGRNEEAIKDLKYFLTFYNAGKEVEDAKARLAKLEP